jgi:hypothetical protein
MTSYAPGTEGVAMRYGVRRQVKPGHEEHGVGSPPS